jgi:hypothetical protein
MVCCRPVWEFADRVQITWACLKHGGTDWLSQPRLADCCAIRSLRSPSDRKDFLPSEIDAIRKALEPIEAAAAKKRIETGRPPQGKFPVGQTGKTRDKVGAFAGVSGRTVEKIAKVVEAAERQPEKFGNLVAEMDRTGKGQWGYRKLRQPRMRSVSGGLSTSRSPSRRLARASALDRQRFLPGGNSAETRPTHRLGHRLALDRPCCIVPVWRLPHPDAVVARW